MLNIQMQIICMDGEIFQKLPVKGFKWVKKFFFSEFSKDFIKKYDEDTNTGYFFEVDFDYPK